MTGPGDKQKKSYVLESFLRPGIPISFSGSFRDNVRRYLEACCTLEDSESENTFVWRNYLHGKEHNFEVPLYTIHESVKNSDQPNCNFCQYSGWGQNFVSKRKYHFIIPIDEEWKPVIVDGFIDIGSHILHGLIHSNGLGHLLCINGIEGGSKFICGREVMDLWDRICTALRIRKSSVIDYLKKRSMDLKILYGISYGETWFEKGWGYEFHHGSFGVREEEKEQALQVLATLNLDTIIKDYFQISSINEIISRYRELSNTTLVTVGDLFKHMLTQNKNPNSKTNVYADLSFIYDCLFNKTNSENVKMAVNAVSNGKHYMKLWAYHEPEDHSLWFFCSLATDINRDSQFPSGDEVVVALSATIKDLKIAAQSAFRDTYCIMENLEINEIDEWKNLDDKDLIFGILPAGLNLSFRGTGVDLLTKSKLKFEFGEENWVVNCKCGANDDDGEEMVECDSCGVWHHTICNEYNSNTAEEYICPTCANKEVVSRHGGTGVNE